MRGKLYIDKFFIISPVRSSSAPGCLDYTQQSSQVENQPSAAAKKKARYGLKGLTPKGKRAIISSCALLEKFYRFRNLGFYTLTCPYSSEEQIKTFNLLLPEIQRRFFQELARLYSRRGVNFYYVCVAEFQQRGALHLHFLAPARHKNNFILRAEVIRALWRRIVSSLLKCDADFRCSLDCHLLRKSAIRYLSKYLSKDKDLIQKYQEWHPPKQWWSVSAKLKQAYLMSISRLDPEIGSCIFKEPEKFSSFYVPIEKEGLGCVAIIGFLKDEYFSRWYEAPLPAILDFLSESSIIHV